MLANRTDAEGEDDSNDEGEEEELQLDNPPHADQRHDEQRRDCVREALGVRVIDAEALEA